MKKTVVSSGAFLSICPILGFVFLSQEQPKVRSSFESETFFEQQIGESSKVRLSAIPASQQFKVVKPPVDFGLSQLSDEWWKCPKTNKRPGFAVVGIRYKDLKNPAAKVFVIEWKHVPGYAAHLTSSVSEGPLRPAQRLGEDFITPFIGVGTNGGTDIAVYCVGLPLDRIKEMTKWVTADPSALDWLNATLDPAPKDEDPKYVAMRNQANTNARALATVVQSRAISSNFYAGKFDDYALEMGGSVPLNPCTGTRTGYTVSSRSTTAQVHANRGTKCGSWTPMTFHLTL